MTSTELKLEIGVNKKASSGRWLFFLYVFEIIPLLSGFRTIDM
jgi:hypothetical protein